MVVAVKIPKLVAGYSARPIDLQEKAAYGTLCIVGKPIDLLDTTWSTFCPLHSCPHIWSKNTECSNLQSLLIAARGGRIQSSTPDIPSSRYKPQTHSVCL